MKLLYPFARRFIAGHDFESAKPKIRKLIDDGYEVSIDYLGESTKTVEDATAAVNQYIDIIKFYKDSKIDISIKPTQVGLLIDKNLCFGFLKSVVEAASNHGHTVRLDMEDSSVTSDTIDICIKLKEIYNNIGVAIQANLIRSEEDLETLVKNGVSVRLVKGAYLENERVAYQKDGEIISCFFAHAAYLYSEKAYNPAIATHDEELLEDITELMPNPDYFDYEFLYGIRRDLQKKFLIERENHVRIYIPFGEQWFPYTLRRLREWKNLKFVVVNIFKEWFR